MGTGGTVAGVVIGAGLGLAAGWFLAGRDARGASDAARRGAPAADDPGIAADAFVSKAESRAIEAERKLREATAERASLTQQVEDLRREVKRLGEAASKPVPAPGAAAAGAAKAHAFRFPELDEALGKVDWNVVGASLAKMGPLCAKFADEIAQGRELPPDVVGDLQKHNGPLVTQALRAAGKVPGTGPNGAFTHPTFSVNAMAAALEALGMPATESQSAALHGVARRYAAEDAQRLAAYDDRTFQLRRIVEEGGVRTRFFADALAVLTEDQRAALRPAATRDRTSLDLWSSGLFWSQWARPAAYAGREQFLKDFGRGFVTGIKLDEAARARAEEMRAAWALSLPADLLKRADDPLSRMGMLSVPFVEEMAAQELALLERMAAELPLEGDSLAAAKKLQLVAVPIARGETDDDE